MTLVSRRRVVGLGAGFFASSALGSCRDDTPDYVCLGDRASGSGLGLDCSEDAPLVDEMVALSQDDVVPWVAGRLRAGTESDAMYAAALSAGAKTLLPTREFIHELKALYSARVVDRRVPPDLQHIPLMWAIHAIKALEGQERAMLDAGRRQGQLRHRLCVIDETELPADPAGAFDEALRARDTDAADAALVAWLRRDGVEPVVQALIYWAGRNQALQAHTAIGVSQYVRLLDAVGSRCAMPALRQVVYQLTGADAMHDWIGATTSDTWEHSRGLVTTLDANWREGRTDAAASVELLHALRIADPFELAEVMRDALASGTSEPAAWTGIALRATEAFVRGANLHVITGLNALHALAGRAAASETAALLLIQAAAWLPLFGEQTRDDEIDTLELGPPPSTLDDVLASRTEDIALTYRRARSWLAHGDPDEFLQYIYRVAVEKGTDAHVVKLPVAFAEEVAEAPTELRPLILAGAASFGRSPNDADWPLLAAAREELD